MEKKLIPLNKEDPKIKISLEEIVGRVETGEMLLDGYNYGMVAILPTGNGDWMYHLRCKNKMYYFERLCYNKK